MSKIRSIAFYLPQYYPTPENDKWWGKGFTEWTNVGRAKPLFRGHYQPRVPSDLGYYDLRLPSVRQQQADYAREAGIEGFCYWHYWFNGKRLLSDVFSEVVESGKPDFPFCLCWANHSWLAKVWDGSAPDTMLMEQTYPGKDDYVNHFHAMLKAFQDPRYIRVEGKPLFGIFDPAYLPDFKVMKETWNTLAQKNGFEGFFFFALAQGMSNYNAIDKSLYDAVVYDAMYDAVWIHNNNFIMKARAKLGKLFNLAVPMEYQYYADTAIRCFKNNPSGIPCIDPNFDHSPRSGKSGVILHNSTPKKWGDLCRNVASILPEDSPLLFIKSWNEWGEGNYLEPDMKWGHAYLDAMAEVFK